MSSLIKEIEKVEASLTALCAAVKPKITSTELRNEYYTLLNQATSALNQVRGIAETSDFLTGFGSRSGTELDSYSDTD